MLTIHLTVTNDPLPAWAMVLRTDGNTTIKMGEPTNDQINAGPDVLSRALEFVRSLAQESVITVHDKQLFAELQDRLSTSTIATADSISGPWAGVQKLQRDVRHLVSYRAAMESDQGNASRLAFILDGVSAMGTTYSSHSSQGGTWKDILAGNDNGKDDSPANLMAKVTDPRTLQSVSHISGPAVPRKPHRPSDGLQARHLLLGLSMLCILAIVFGLPEAVGRAAGTMGRPYRFIVSSSVAILACVPMLMLWFHLVRRIIGNARK